MIKYLEENLAWFTQKTEESKFAKSYPPPPLIIGTGFQLCMLKKPNAAGGFNLFPPADDSSTKVGIWETIHTNTAMRNIKMTFLC